VAAVLREIETIREVRRICCEDGPLYRELKDLLNSVRVRLPKRIPEYAQWQRPWGDTFDEIPGLCVAPDRTWKTASGDSICVVLAVPLDLADPEDGDDPWVGIYLPSDLPRREVLIPLLEARIPDGFTNVHPGLNPDPDWPLWRYISLRRFAGSERFETAQFLDAICEAFQALLPLRGVIDEFLRQRR